MSSAAPPVVPTSTPTSSILREVQALYRRVLVLSSAGKHGEASELQTERLDPLVARARESGDATDAKLQLLFAAEQTRVDDAHALAEVLLPLLTANSSSASAVATSAPHMSDSRDVSSDAPAATAPYAGNSGARNETGQLPGIADFIDEMLTQDRGPRKSRRSA